MGWLQNALQAVAWGCGGIVLTGVALLITFQEKLVYVPDIPGVGKAYAFTPSRLRMRYEDVWIRAKDGTRLHGWLIKYSDDPDCPTMLFFQENAGNISHRLDSIKILMSELHCNVFMPSYRGYGASDGTPTEKGIVLDAQAALDYLLERRDINKKKIIVFGRSLGGAVASKLVFENQKNVAALILENTFTSILDMAGVMLPFLKYVIGGQGFRPLNFFVRNKWKTIDIIQKIHVPMLLLSGARDELVPPSHMSMLHSLAKSNKSNNSCVFKEFKYGTHMDTWLKGGAEYWKTIRSFLAIHSSVGYDHGYDADDSSHGTRHHHHHPHHQYYDDDEDDGIDYGDSSCGSDVYNVLERNIPFYQRRYRNDNDRNSNENFDFNEDDDSIVLNGPNARR